MITKGILKTINYNENSCTVRIPLFETASSNNEVILSAVFLTQPGSYNGYSEGDIVFIDFENNSLNNPIVLGKLYLGAAKEKVTPKKGGLTVADLSVTSSASLPLDTKLTFDKSDSTVVPVEGGFSTYSSLLDIIKALYKTETSITKATEESLENITKIKVEYLSQPVLKSEPTKENPGWSIVVPAYQDGYSIWQKTTCYNKKGQILGEPEIICLSDTTAIPSYWLNCSTKTHNGKQQTTDITLQVMVKIGTNTETFSTEDIIKYKWESETDWTTGSYTVTIEASDCKDEDLLVEVWRNNGTTSYTAETITFMPKGIPVLDLNPDSAYLAYDSKGLSKLNPPEKAITTASVYFNGELVTTIPNNNFTWTVTGGTSTSSEGPTIEITDIDDAVDSATAECNVTHNGVSLKKTFTVTKLRKGGSNYKIDIENDYVSIITGNTGIINNYNWDENTKHILTLYYGDEIIETNKNKINIEEPKDDGKLYLKVIPSYVTSNTLTATKDEYHFTNTISAISELSDTGEIKYQLFEGLTLVASATFKVVRIRQGQPAISYWLKASSDIHLGTEQNTNLIITAMCKEGTAAEATDKTATLWWWNPSIADAEEGQPLANKWIKASTAPLYSLTFTKDDFKNTIKNNSLKILATHDDTFEPAATTDLTAPEVYELETLSYSPRNTPILELTNESDALSYSYLGQKIGLDEASTVAKVYLNGTEVQGATYVWKFYTINETGERSEITNLKETDSVTKAWITNIDVNNAEIKITHIPTTKIEAECTASYSWDGQSTTLIKKFTVVRQLQGADGADAIMYKATATSEVVKWNTNGECETESITFSLNKITGSNIEPTTFWLIMQTNNTKPWTQGDKGYATTYTMSSLTGITQKCTLLFYADKTSRNNAFKELDDTLNWQSLKSELKPVDVIEVIAVKDGNAGDPIIVQYAYRWSNDYLASPLKPAADAVPDLTETKWKWPSEQTWKASNYTPAADDTHKIIFVSRRMGIESKITSAPWSNPEIFDTHDEKAYQILKTSEGLFGYGQGVYYTPTETITLADGSTKNAGDPITQEQATKFVALDPNTNKEKVKLYIDANYIRTGAFTVKDGNNILFQAGLDTGANKTPIVKITDFDVGTKGIYNTNFITSFTEATSANKVNKPGVYIGTDGIRLGDNFSVDPNGNVRASSLKVSASNVEGLGSLATKDGLSAVDVGAATMDEVESKGYQDSTGVVSIIDNTVDADFINARNITANQIEVKDKYEKTIFKASATDKSTTIGYFEVTEKGLSMSNKSGAGVDKGENNSDTSNLFIDNNHILMQGNAKNSSTPSSSSFGNFYYGMSPDNGPGGYGLFGSFITRIHTTALNWSSATSDTTLITEVPGIIEANFSRKSSIDYRPTTIIIAQIPISKGTNYWNITKTISGALQIEQDGKRVDSPGFISFSQCIPEKLLANILNIQATVCMNATPPSTTGGWAEVTHPITLYAHEDVSSKSTVVIHSNADCSAYVSVYCSVYPTGYITS